MKGMDEQILNTVYSSSLEFGKNFHRPIIEIIEELYPDISNDEKISIVSYIEQTRNDIENYFYSNYDYKSEDANKELQHRGKQWIKNKYHWMNTENINRSANQGMYYAWRG